MAVESCGDILALPEHCIANLLSLTSPRDACRLSAVASTFRLATQYDTVWDRFLPSDYRDLLSRADGGAEPLISKFRSKKDLYLHLCDHPILIDGGRKSFSLEKCSGKKCFMIAARDLDIAWSNTPQYWRWISLPESRFFEVAELLHLCWFHIRGKISTKMLSSGTCYVAYLVFARKSGAFKFDLPAEACVELSSQESERQKVFLGRDRAHGSSYRRLPRLVRQQQTVEDVVAEFNAKYPKPRSDGWIEVELGEYFVEGREDDVLELGLREVNDYHGKSGLIVQGIELRPKAMGGDSKKNFV